MTTVRAVPTFGRPAPPGALTLLLAQSRYAATEYWRARVVLVFSLIFPLVWLVFIGAVAGNQVLDPATGLRVMQFATPLAVAMGTMYATLPTVAITVTEARERGVLKRLSGTPLPTWTYLAGRAIGALALAAAAVALALVVAVAAYDVQVIWRTALATGVTVAVALVCFVAVGLAISTLCHSTGTAEGSAIGSVVVLSFISGLYIPNGLPEPVTRVAALFPVKPYADTLRAQFDPATPGSGWDARTLAILLVWAAAGALVAAARLRAVQSGVHGRRTAVAERPARRTTAAVHRTAGEAGAPAEAGVRHLSATRVASPSLLAMAVAQAGSALRATARDPGAVIFAGAVPVGLFALLASASRASAGPGSAQAIVESAAGMVAWGAAVTAFLNLPEAVVKARERGVLKRLRGTPLPPAALMAGRVVAALMFTAIMAAAVFGLGRAAFGLTLTPGRVAAASCVLALGTLTLAACGFLLAAVVRSARAFGAVGLVMLLPVAFVSDVFGLAGPAWMDTLGSALPLKHLQNALADVLAGGAPRTWVHVAALVGWAAAAALLAGRNFRWNDTE